MSSDEDGFLPGQQNHDIVLTGLAILGVVLTALLLVSLFAPPRIGAPFEPVTDLFVEDVAGFLVWQLVAVVVMALGSWFLILDIRSEQK